MKWMLYILLVTGETVTLPTTPLDCLAAVAALRAGSVYAVQITTGGPTIAAIELTCLAPMDAEASGVRAAGS